MKLNISAIPDQGLEIDFAQREPWQLHLLQQTFHEQNADSQSLCGNLLVVNTERHIMITGEFRVLLRPFCDRCLTEFTCEFQVPIMLGLAPLYHSAKEKERLKGFKSDVDAAKDDDNFSFYEGNEIDLAQTIGEQVLLARPVQFICSEACRGLCPQCGANLNQQVCDCCPPKASSRLLPGKS